MLIIQHNIEYYAQSGSALTRINKNSANKTIKLFLRCMFALAS